MKRGVRDIAWLELLLVASLVALVAQLGWPTLDAWLNRPRAGRQVAQQFEGMNYWLYLPRSHGQSVKQWPLLLFLHGSGERGTDIPIVKRGGPPALIERGRHFPMIVVSPQCPLDQNWEPTALLALLDHIEQQFAVDRVMVTGYSMGGYGTWALAEAAPERLAAIAPVSGGGDVARATALVKLPIWAFHGELDRAVPLEVNQAMVDAVNAAGGNARITVYEDEGHGICGRVYDNRQLYDWLLAQ